VWHEREISLLAILTNQCEQALERARLFQSEQARRRAADTLREVAQTLTSLLAPGDITTLILDQLRRVVPSTTAALMLRDGNLLRITATRGFADAIRSRIEQTRFNLDKDPNLAWIIRNRQPLVVEDAQATEAFIPIKGSEHIHGWIGAPLLLDDEVIGLLTVDSSTVGAYSQEDAQLAFALASLAAQAIRNSRLFDEVNRFAVQIEQRVVERTAELADANAQLSAEKERLKAVHAITLELAQSLDLEATLTKALGLVSRALGTRHGSIMLRDLATERLICRAVLTDNGNVQATSEPLAFASGLGLAGWVMRNRQSVCLPDVRKDPRWLAEEGRAEAVRSVAALPLMTKDETLGVLLLSSARVNYFSASQLQLISTIANEIAIVIHNAELYSFITDQSLRVSELLEHQRRETGKSQAILQSVTEGVIMVDEQQQVVLFNPAAEQLLRIPAEFMLQQPLARLREYGPSAGDAQRAGLIYVHLEEGLRTLGEGEISSHSQILELPAPAQFIVLNYADVLQPFGSPYGCVIVLSDITDEIESDRAKSDFVSSIVRDLRDPLTSIKGYADLFLLGKAGRLTNEQLAFVRIIKNNANRLTELNNAIAMIGSIDSGKIREGNSPEPIDLAGIIRQVCQAMRPEIEHKALRLHAALAPDIPLIRADLGQITYVLQALISNAIKFSYPGGAIEIRVTHQADGTIQTDVADSGVGIAPEQQQALFRRFYRADNPLRETVGGAGLGLAIARALVELFGGAIWVQSEAGKGSTFSFCLPVAQPISAGQEQAGDI